MRHPTGSRHPQSHTWGRETPGSASVGSGALVPEDRGAQKHLTPSPRAARAPAPHLGALGPPGPQVWGGETHSLGLLDPQSPHLRTTRFPSSRGQVSSSVEGRFRFQNTFESLYFRDLLIEFVNIERSNPYELLHGFVHI